MRGRKPVPTPLKVVRGNPGRRPLNDAEPKPALRLPAAPSHLGAEGKKEWRRIGRELKRLGLIAEIDRAALASYCSAWERYVEAEQNIRQFGLVLVAKDGKSMYQNPYVGLSNRAMELMLRVAAEFGMTPSARSRVRAEPAGEGDGFEGVHR